MSALGRVQSFPPNFPVALFSASETSARNQRRRVARVRRHIIVLCAMLMWGSLGGWPQAPPQDGPAVTLGIEVRLPDDDVFYIPVVGDGEILGIVPVPIGPFAGIRITPRMRSDSVKIEVAALTSGKRMLSEEACLQVLSLNSEDAGSYGGKRDESLLLTGLERIGLPVLRVKVVPVHGPPPGGFHHPYANSSAFCGCEYPRPRSIITNPDGSSASGVAGIMSFPDAGKCVQIRGCGQCYRISPPLHSLTGL
jgi:hypothetical protein